MASQLIPKYYDPVVELLEDAADGAALYEVAIGLKQNIETALRADLEALVGKPAGPGGVPPAIPGLKALWNTAKAERTAKSAAFQSKKSESRTLAATCANILKPRLGNSWNNAWQNAGFTNATLEIPDNPLTLLQQFRAYFAANPAHEVESLGATAEACEAMAGAISAASTASNNSNTAAGTARNNLETGIRAARRRLTGLREELAQLIGEDDERWYAFGFNKPNDPVTPEVPENLTAVAGAPGSGSVSLDWDDARRAEGFRATVFLASTGAELAEKLVQDSDANFTDLPKGQNLRIAIRARNESGESQAAETNIVLPSDVPPPAQAVIDQVENQGSGNFTLHYHADGAASFDIFVKPPGQDQFLSFGSGVTETHFAISSAAGSPWFAYVVPRNEGGEGPASETVTFDGI